MQANDDDSVTKLTANIADMLQVRVSQLEVETNRLQLDMVAACIIPCMCPGDSSPEYDKIGMHDTEIPRFLKLHALYWLI